MEREDEVRVLELIEQAIAATSRTIRTGPESEMIVIDKLLLSRNLSNMIERRRSNAENPKADTDVQDSPGAVE